LLAQKLSEHVYRVVDRLYADGICANMIASVVYLSGGCLLGRTASERVDLVADHRTWLFPVFQPSLRSGFLLFRTIRI
jgi:hypothetical protein